MRDYATKRLLEDIRTSKRGRAAELSRITGFKAATFSNLKDGHRAIGDKLMHALAEKVWGISTAELEQLSYEAAGKRWPTPKIERGSVLSHHPRWLELVALAKASAPSVPAYCFDEVGERWAMGATGLPDVLEPADIATIAKILASRAPPTPSSSRPPKAPPSGLRPSVADVPASRRSSSK